MQMKLVLPCGDDIHAVRLSAVLGAKRGDKLDVIAVVAAEDITNFIII